MSRSKNKNLKLMLAYLAETGVKKVQPEVFMPSALKVRAGKLWVGKKSYDLGRRIFVVGAGKAAAAMAVELEKIIGVKNITTGLVICNNKSWQPKKIKICLAGHPLPSRSGMTGTKSMLAFKQKYGLNKKDLIIALVSGGGSALMFLPVPGITLADKKKLTRALLLSGKNGYEIPTVKRKLSKVKGGGLAKFFYPTPIISLVLSDVLNDDLATIASGPFSPDNTSFQDAWRVIERVKNVPLSVREFIKKNRFKKNSPMRFPHVYQKIIASNATALLQIKKKARSLGWDVRIGRWLQSETKTEAQAVCCELDSKKLRRTTLYLFGAETAVDLKGEKGKGGRNQEFVLACLDCLRRQPFKYDWAIMSFATDGVDYIKESAGGLINRDTLAEIKKQKTDISSYLRRHDSYRILKKLKANFKFNSPTSTNVCDIVMVLLKP